MQRLKESIRGKLPRPLLMAYRWNRALLRRWQYRGSQYYCNVCDARLSDWIFAGPRDHGNRVCPVCHSYGRQRLLALVLERELSVNQSDASGNGKLLHFAPEIGLQRWIRRHFPLQTYVSADLSSSEADISLDVQSIDLPDESIYAMLLSHVLEHVENDVLALREMRRVLAPGGMLFVQVPISRAYVSQEEYLDTPELRLERYGKTDHVRLYGEDILVRLCNAGFRVTKYHAGDAIFSGKRDYMALDIPSDSTMLYASESTTYVCHKD
jgi:SAM-dependent methyltransferase